MKPNILFSLQMSCIFRYTLLVGECFGFFVIIPNKTSTSIYTADSKNKSYSLWCSNIF